MTTPWIDRAPTPVNILSLLLALLFLIAGGTKLAGMEAHVQEFQDWGFPPWFLYLTGLLEVVGAVLVALLPTRLYGALLLLAVMAGAMGTHLWHAEWGQFFVPLIVFLLLAIVAWASRHPAAR